MNLVWNVLWLDFHPFVISNPSNPREKLRGAMTENSGPTAADSANGQVAAADVSQPISAYFKNLSCDGLVGEYSPFAWPWHHIFRFAPPLRTPKP